MKDLESLFETVVSYEDQIVDSAFLGQPAKSAFISQISSETNLKKEMPLKRLFVFGVATAVFLIGALFILFSSVTSMDHGETTWVKVIPGEAEEFSFIDGSKIRLHEKSIARLSSAFEPGGIVTLEKGKASIHINKQAKSSWTVHAGPYIIIVTGTQFDVAWDMGQEEFSLNLFEGEILLKGPMIEGGQQIIAPRKVVASLQKEHLELTRIQQPLQKELEEQTLEMDIIPQEKEQEVLASEEKTEEKELRKTVLEEFKNKKNAEPKWKDLIKKGNCNSLIEFFSTSKIEVLLQNEAAEEIFSIADFARRCSDVDLAERAYILLRKKFPGSGHAATCAFYLGRIAFDQKQDYKETVHWLQIYLKEQQGGTLHRETLGRLMEAQQKAGMSKESVSTARSYLTQYPDGPHHSKAREIARE